MRRKIAAGIIAIMALFIGSVPFVITEQDAKSPYLEYGIPSKNVQVVSHNGFIIGYNPKTKQASWTIYILTKEQMEGPRVKRSNDFREDLAVKDGPTPEDYKNSGYDKGHMVPAGDMAYSKASMSDCFYMTNMSPQLGVLNQKRWNDLEVWIRKIVMEYKKLVIITGPIYDPVLPSKSIGKGVRVPQSYYKIIYHPKEPVFMVAFIMPNAFCKEELHKYVVSVDEVERLTGMDFFSNLTLRDQMKYEAEVNSQIVQ